jgi:hypothetical protein
VYHKSAVALGVKARPAVFWACPQHTDQDPGFVGAASRVQGSSQHMPGKLLPFQAALCACADTCCQSQNLFTKPVQLRCSSAEGFSRPCGVPCLVLRRAVVWCGVLWLVCIRCSTQLVGCVVCRSSLTVGLRVVLCCVVAWSLGRPSPCTRAMAPCLYYKICTAQAVLGSILPGPVA